MSDSVHNQVQVLKEVEEELWKIPAHVIASGKGVQNPKYREQTQRLEALMAKLSLTIKTLQNNPHSKGPDAQKALKYARELEGKIREAEGRAVERNVHELLADGLKRIHEYHALVEVPDKYHSHAPGTVKPEPIEGILVLLFSILARYVQLRKRSQES